MVICLSEMYLNLRKYFEETNFFLAFWIATVNLLPFSTGCAFSWYSPVIPKLTGKMGKEMNPLHDPLSVDEKAWLVSLLPLGAIFGGPLAGFISSRYGKKKAMILSGMTLFVSFLMTAVFYNINCYYISKFLGGLGVGSCSMLVPLYTGECAAKANRGTLSCFFGVFLKTGMFFSFAVGSYCTVQLFSFLCSIPVFVFLILFGFYCPETPYHLVLSGNIDGAEKVLMKLRQRKHQKEIGDELNEIVEYIKNDAKNKKKNVLNTFNDKSSRRSLAIAVGIMWINQLCGIIAVISYLQTIFEEYSNVIRADIATMAIGVMQIFVSFFTSQVIEKFGRRLLLLISTAISCSSLLAIAVYLTLKHYDFEIQSYYWIPFMGMILYFIAFDLGLGPVTWTLMGEIFDTNVKSLGASIASCSSKILAFLITLIFPWIAKSIGMEGSFYIFSLFMFLGFNFVLLFLPETKSKSFAEIKVMLEKGFLQIRCSEQTYRVN